MQNSSDQGVSLTNDVTLDVAGATEIRTFDAKTLKPAGTLKFAQEP